MADKIITTLSRRDEMALRIICALFQSPRSLSIEEDEGKKRSMGLNEVGETAVEIADAMIAKLDEVPDAET